ncbi:hypothetical protein BsWGS_08884 [Bradybaena similaris]
MNSFTVCFHLSLLVTASLAYSKYRDEIPNGQNVPHPCKVNYRWSGVGHENPNGGGERNAFGLAFAAADHKWTKDLCLADSDGDGKTNGQELGDPQCTWKPNTSPSRTVNITNPGICDPYNSDGCKSKTTFVSCELDSFQSCQAINNANVKNINLTFPKTQVPSTETNYMCFSFDVPNDQDYHVVANKPIISNQNVVHHMLLFGCTSSEGQTEATPVACGMGSSRYCKSIIGMWSVGFTGSCYGTHVGFRIGRTGYKRVSLQIHYNNPELVQNYTDSSGMRLYYKPVEEGVQDLGVLMIGQMLLQLPPGQSSVQAESSACPSNCTQKYVVKSTNIIKSANHMHYLGKSMTVSVYRNGAKLRDLSYDPAYSYDSPVEHKLDPEFELLPGDEITTTCVYNTLTSSRHVYYGESTSDEMCFGFITFYPKDAISVDKCTSFGKYSQCQLESRTPMDGCNFAEFLNFTNPTSAKIVQDVTKNCNLDGFCRLECRAVLNGLKEHPCLKGTANQWVTRSLSNSKEGVNFLGRLRSCSVTESCTDQCSSCIPDEGDDASRILVNSAILLLTPALIMFL